MMVLTFTPPVLMLLLLVITIVYNHAHADAAACSRWPRDSEKALSDWEECERCLATRDLRVESMEDTELTWNRTRQTFEVEELPRIVCKLWAENCTIIAFSTGTFKHAPCLRRVFLSDNCLEKLIPNTFYNNSELLHLELQRNKIVLPRNQAFIISLSLRILNLSYNNITVVYNETFKEIPNVSILFLRGNKITCLTYDIFIFLNRLEFLDVTGNSLTTLEFAPKLTVLCLYAGLNPIGNLLPILTKFRMNVTLGFSQEICCCKANYCYHSASQWISKCEQCNRIYTSRTQISTTEFSRSELNTTALSIVTSEISYPNRDVNFTLKSLNTIIVPMAPNSYSGSKNKLNAQTANFTVILMSTIFSFLIIVQSSIIVFLLVKAKRKVSSNMVLEVPSRTIIVPSTIYGTEQITDLDEETCSHLSLNPVYETIPETRKP